MVHLQNDESLRFDHERTHYLDPHFYSLGFVLYQQLHSAFRFPIPISLLAREAPRRFLCRSHQQKHVSTKDPLIAADIVPGV